MVNTPSNDPPEKPDWLMRTLNPLADALEYVGKTLYVLFQTRIPAYLQNKEGGLTREKFEDFYSKYYERLRGQRTNAIRKAQGLGDLWMADGWSAHHDRKKLVFDDLIGEFGWQDDADIRTFLRDIFLDPGLV